MFNLYLKTDYEVKIGYENKFEIRTNGEKMGDLQILRDNNISDTVNKEASYLMAITGLPDLDDEKKEKIHEEIFNAEPEPVPSVSAVQQMGPDGKPLPAAGGQPLNEAGKIEDAAMARAFKTDV